MNNAIRKVKDNARYDGYQVLLRIFPINISNFTCNNIAMFVIMLSQDVASKLLINKQIVTDPFGSVTICFRHQKISASIPTSIKK